MVVVVVVVVVVDDFEWLEEGGGTEGLISLATSHLYY